MTAVKLAISLPPSQVARAKRAVRTGVAPSVSAYISRALEAQDREDSMQDLIEDLIAERGEPSADEEAWASRAFRPKSKG